MAKRERGVKTGAAPGPIAGETHAGEVRDERKNKCEDKCNRRQRARKLVAASRNESGTM